MEGQVLILTLINQKLNYTDIINFLPSNDCISLRLFIKHFVVNEA